jgi:CDP-diacylglycerol--serine O-phosphatidyltransferase
MATNPAAKRHFSMIREFHLADFITLANAACGVAAVLLAMLYMDRARSRTSSSPRRSRPPPSSSTCSTGASRARASSIRRSGRELDSLSDVISFGVAPAALAFAAGMRGGWDAIALRTSSAAG